MIISLLQRHQGVNFHIDYKITNVVFSPIDYKIVTEVLATMVIDIGHGLRARKEFK